MKVLCVCLGNICRSPAAEAALRALAPEWDIDSAGTGGWHVGDPPYAPMQSAALLRGLDLSDLRARQFEATDFEYFDLILGMDAQNVADIERLRPRSNATPVRRFGPQDVPDPYYTGEFDTALDLIQRFAMDLVSGKTSRPPA